jgi:hypothetical protein
MKTLLKKFERMMVAVTFAEAGEFETAGEEMKDKAEDKVLVKNLRMKKLAEAQQEAMEAVTYAEAGEQAYAKTLMEEGRKEEDKMLVVGDEKFSPALMEYSLNMAERMGLSIIAINIIPIKKEIAKLISAQRQQQFVENLKQIAAEFSAQAASRGVKFDHQVHFGRQEATIKQMCREIKKVTFVLTEPDEVCSMDSQKVSIPVYCISDKIN